MRLTIKETMSDTSEHGIFYKNVDICDLPSILKKGILSMKSSGNDNWNSNRRVNNSRDLVYLFRPTGYENSFVQYGLALLEVEVDGIQNQILDNDINKGNYIEYICDSVPSDNIVSVYLPEIFKDQIDFRHPKIKWVTIDADIYDYKTDSYVKCDGDTLEQFVKTVKNIDESGEYNYLRGTYPDKTVLDLYSWHYNI